MLHHLSTDRGALADALLITCDKQIVPINLPTGDTLLAVMYATLRCTTVDVVAVTKQWDMWIDDEGLLDRRPVNPLATMLAHRFGHTGYRIHGPALIAGRSEDKTRPLTADSLSGLHGTLAELSTEAA